MGLPQTGRDILHIVGGHLPDVGRLVELMTEARPRVGDVEDVANGASILVQEPDALCLVLDIAGKPRVPEGQIRAGCSVGAIGIDQKLVLKGIFVVSGRAA